MVGVPDERYGEAVVAVVAPRPGAEVDGDEVRLFVRSRLAGYKCPKAVVVVDRVRRAPNGKADYGWARQAAADRLPDGIRA
ncbi:MAG TPA: hypothetical protein VFH45_07805 [Acidimicrobiales bacterium]|nr:hypothetical protein [Acidimicrobiales bacterium]